jgi:hypothetical protein
MKNYLYSLFIIFVIFPAAHAGEAYCTIEIEDENGGVKYKIEQQFTYTGESHAQKKLFKLPGSKYNCSFTFVNLSIGTMLSCGLDEVGYNFVQSDRTGNKEVGVKNSLTFRHNNNFYKLAASCK